MNRSLLRRSIGWWGFLFFGVLGHGAFQDPLWSARVAALGGAYTTMGDDATAAFYNPAATVAMEHPTAQFSYAKLFTGLEEVDLSLNNLAYVHPVGEWGVLTAGWGSVVAGGVRREDTLTVGGAHLFKNIPYVGDVAVGMSLRHLSQSYTLDQRTTNDPVFQEGRTKSDVAVDAHVYVPPVPVGHGRVSTGISFRALNAPDVGFATAETLPVEIALGVQYQWGRYSFPVDIVTRSGEVTPQFGVEALFLENRMAIRAGSDTNQVGAGLGYQHQLNDRLGLSFDYAFLWPLELKETSGSHRATVGIKF